MIEISQADWKMFRKLLPQWQEAYMAKLCREYIDLLSSDEDASEKFWKLESRLSKDKTHPGVCVELRRSDVMYNMFRLLKDGAITRDDLSGFSPDFQEDLDSYIRLNT